MDRSHFIGIGQHTKKAVCQEMLESWTVQGTAVCWALGAWGGKSVHFRFLVMAEGQADKGRYATDLPDRQDLRTQDSTLPGLIVGVMGSPVPGQPADPASQEMSRRYPIPFPLVCVPMSISSFLIFVFVLIQMVSLPEVQVPLQTVFQPPSKSISRPEWDTGLQ